MLAFDRHLIGESLHAAITLSLYYFLYFCPAVINVYEPFVNNLQDVLARYFKCSDRVMKFICVFCERFIILTLVSFGLYNIFDHYHIQHAVMLLVTDILVYSFTSFTIPRYATAIVLFRVALLVTSVSLDTQAAISDRSDTIMNISNSTVNILYVNSTT